MATVGPMRLTITVNNEAVYLYVDGVLTSLPNYRSFLNADTIVIPADTSVIAVQGRDWGVSFSLI